MPSNIKLSPCPLPTTNDQEIDLTQLQGQWIILYFYPKDATPGCTVEAQQFREAHAKFTALNAIILGVSRDNITSHEKFKHKEQLPFDLLSDEQAHLCEQFGVMKLKNRYGKSIRGIERSTFIIDPDGVVQHEWRNVKVADHVREVYQTLIHLQHGS
ncbi:MAG TPA: peroxiredoxin [Legionellaceae bacterium]|nr:peroxiredoxin [Legionellaceae bacterium]